MGRKKIYAALRPTPGRACAHAQGGAERGGLSSLGGGGGAAGDDAVGQGLEDLRRIVR